MEDAFDSADDMGASDFSDVDGSDNEMKVDIVMSAEEAKEFVDMLVPTIPLPKHTKACMHDCCYAPAKGIEGLQGKIEDRIAFEELCRKTLREMEFKMNFSAFPKEHPHIPHVYFVRATLLLKYIAHLRGAETFEEDILWDELSSITIESLLQEGGSEIADELEFLEPLTPSDVVDVIRYVCAYPYPRDFNMDYLTIVLGDMGIEVEGTSPGLPFFRYMDSNSLSATGIDEDLVDVINDHAARDNGKIAKQ